jgi:hypothetical protein
MRALVVAVALVLAGCTGGSSDSFRIHVDDQPIELTAPTTVIVQIFVLVAPGTEVTLSSPNLPGFATISGETIQLSPVAHDAGDYAIELVATSGGDSAHGTLRLHVVGMNTGPMWQPVPFFSSGNPATIRAPVCDKEHDNFTFEVSVALTSDPIPNTPMFTHFIDFTQITPMDDGPDVGWCADFITELPGLAPGTYHGSMHAVDVYGAEDPYGWVEVPSTFTVP